MRAKERRDARCQIDDALDEMEIAKEDRAAEAFDDYHLAEATEVFLSQLYAEEDAQDFRGLCLLETCVDRS